MTHLWSEGEPITVEVNSQGQPVRFTWQGRQHQLKYIIEHWQIDVDWWSEHGRIWRSYMTITAGSLLCVIYQDLVTHEWRLVRVYD